MPPREHPSRASLCEDDSHVHKAQLTAATDEIGRLETEGAEATEIIDDLRVKLRKQRQQLADCCNDKTEIRRKRTEDRKQWTEECARRKQLQKEVKALKLTLHAGNTGPVQTSISGSATAQSLDTPVREPMNLSTTVLEDQINELTLLKLEVKKLNSEQTLAEDLRKENRALHEDKASKTEVLKDLRQQVQTLTGKLEGTKKDLEERKEEISIGNIYTSMLQAELSKLNLEFKGLMKQVERQSAELTRLKNETEQHRGQKRKLTSFLKDIGIGRDDFDGKTNADEPVSTTTSIPANSPVSSHTLAPVPSPSPIPAPQASPVAIFPNLASYDCKPPLRMHEAGTGLNEREASGAWSPKNF